MTTPFTIARLASLTFFPLSLLIGGCGSPSPSASRPSAPVLIVQIEGYAKDAHAALVGPQGAVVVIDGMTPANLPETKPLAKEKVLEADRSIGKIDETAAPAKKAAEADIAARDKAEKALDAKPNPVKVWLNLVGLGLLIGGIGVLIASYFVAFLAGPKTEGLAVAAIIIGLSLLAIAYFFTAIMWIVGLGLLAALIGAGFYLWTHRAVVKANLKSVIPASA